MDSSGAWEKDKDYQCMMAKIDKDYQYRQGLSVLNEQGHLSLHVLVLHSDYIKLRPTCVSAIRISNPLTTSVLLINCYNIIITCTPF